MTGTLLRFHGGAETFARSRHPNGEAVQERLNSCPGEDISEVGWRIVMSVISMREAMPTVEAPLREYLHDETVTPLLHRIRSEFLEMPGLRLTPAQGARLWAVDRHVSQRILEGLTMTGFLMQNREGAFLRASEA
jgi:hypothetical protein